MIYSIYLLRGIISSFSGHVFLNKSTLALGTSQPLGSRMWCSTVSLSLSHWCPGSGVVLDCIDS